MEEEDYNDFEEEQVFFEGDDLTEYASVIQEKIAEYNRVDMTMIRPII